MGSEESSRPMSAADRRPGNQPFYIDSECPKCGTPLVLNDKHQNPDIEPEKIWHDEWACPNKDCPKDGVFMDIPMEYLQKLIEKSEKEYKDLKTLKEVRKEMIK